CGRAIFAEDDLDELEAGLARIAEYLYGRPLFRRFLALTREELAGRRPGFLWTLLADDDGGVFAYEYRLEACAFRRLSEERVGARNGHVSLAFMAFRWRRFNRNVCTPAPSATPTRNSAAPMATRMRSGLRAGFTPVGPGGAAAPTAMTKPRDLADTKSSVRI